MNQLERVLKKEMSLSRRTLTWICVGMAIFYALSIAFCFVVQDAARSLVTDRALRSIVNISELNKDTVCRSIENRRTLLRTVAARLEKRGVTDENRVLAELQDFVEPYDFYNMGILSEDLILHRTDGTALDLKPFELSPKLWSDAGCITASYTPESGDKHMVNAITYPVYSNGKIAFMLFCTIHSELLTDRMNTSSFDGEGYTFIIDRAGKVAIYPCDNANDKYSALMQHINEVTEIEPESKNDIRFVYNGEHYYTHIEKVGINDWYLLTCIRESALFHEARGVSTKVYTASIVLWLMVFFTIGWTFYSMRRARLKRTRETYYDPMLGIPNAKALSIFFESLPEQQRESLSIVVFDVDNFKEYNYMYGSAAGDDLLRYIVRVSCEENPDLLMFRYYSDYFIVLDFNPSHEEVAEMVRRVNERYDSDIASGSVPPFSTSGGVRSYEAGVSLRQLLSDALVARETVKGNHLQHFAYYDGSVRARRLRYAEIDSSFPNALRSHEIRVYYQPKFDMTTGNIIGAEALARWIRQDGSTISPADFIPCLEESRQVLMLDEAILREVCGHIREMRAAGVDVPPVSVNLSRIHLYYSDTVAKIQSILAEYDVEPRLLSFELTETALYEDSNTLKAVMSELHELGCRVEIDDFGVGMSGPMVLSANKFDVVKLDKSFVDDLGDSQVEDIVRSTVGLANRWGMDVLVEGVETREQAERLVELGCTRAQGYYYCRPLPYDEYRRRLGSGSAALAIPMQERSFTEDIAAALDGNLLPTYIIDPERFIVMYCNKTLRQILGYDPTGALCYQKLRGNSSPCGDCTAVCLHRDGSVGPKEIHENGNWMLLHTSPLYWCGRKFIQLTFVDINSQKHMEQELRLRGQEYEAILSESLIGIMRYDIDTDSASINMDRNLERVPEYTIENYLERYRTSGLIKPDDSDVMSTVLEDVLRGVPSRGYNIYITTEGRGRRWIHLDYVILRDEDGKPSRAIISFFDNTEQREKEREYQSWNANLAALIDEQTVYLRVNLSLDYIEAENQFGVWNPDARNRPYGEFMREVVDSWIAAQSRREYLSFMNRERLLGLYYAGTTEDELEYLSVSEGEPVWLRASLSMAADPATHEVKGSFVFRNVDSEVKERERLKHEAERDSLTGLYNRAATERLVRGVLSAPSGERCCFLLIDLDNLRDINSELGHPEGDRAIFSIAETMRTKFRHGDILGRTGGDEFVAFLRNVPEASLLHDAIFDLVARVRACRIGPNGDRPVHISVGGAMCTAGSDDFQSVYEKADLALYYTKAAGKNDFNFYTPEMQDRQSFYVPAHTEEKPGTAWYDSFEIQRLIRAMSPFFTLEFSANLTQNSYHILEYVPYIAERAADDGVYDDIVDIGMRAFHPDDRAEFLATCSRESLLKAYANGQRTISHRGRQQGADGIYRTVQTVILMLQDPETNDICEVTVATVLYGERDG